MKTPKNILLDFINLRISKSKCASLIRHTHYIYIGNIKYNDAVKVSKEVNNYIKSADKAAYDFHKPHVTVSCPQQNKNTYLCAVTLHE